MKKKLSCIEFTIVMILAFLFGMGLSAFLAWVFMWMWNFALVDVFGLPEINLWKAWAIVIILGIVGSFFKSKSK